MLNDLVGAETKCNVSLINGEIVELVFRPFTLKDLAWMQEQFDTVEKRSKLASLAADPICQVIWQLLDAESKAKFSNITFQDIDEKTGQEITVNVIGYEKLLHSLASQDEMLKLFMAYSENESLNSFIPSFAKQSKKKASQSTNLTGFKSLIASLRNMVTHQSSS